MMHTTQTLINIDSAARSACGDYHATVRALSRFATEALVDAAESCRAGSTVDERRSYMSNPTYGTPVRDAAIACICGYVNLCRVREFGATLRAARAEFPTALEALCEAM